MEVHLGARDDDLYHVASSLSEGQVSVLGYNIALRSLETLGQGVYRTGTIEKVELQSSAFTEVSDAFEIRFPLETSFLYDRSRGEIVAELPLKRLPHACLRKTSRFHFPTSKTRCSVVGCSH